jgi:hypothetical protein
MVTRPGSSPIPMWMEKMNESAKDTVRFRRTFRKIAIIFAVVSISSIICGDVVVYRARSRHMEGYTSPLRVGGLPLLSIGRDAHGVFALGGRASGIVAVGGIAVGVVAFGGLSVGAVAIGGVSVGLFILAGIAMGWRAIGAIAVGYGAVGAIAIGRYACGAIAYGLSAASGQVEGLIGKVVRRGIHSSPP